MRRCALWQIICAERSVPIFHVVVPNVGLCFLQSFLKKAQPFLLLCVETSQERERERFHSSVSLLSWNRERRTIQVVVLTQSPMPTAASKEDSRTLESIAAGDKMLPSAQMQVVLWWSQCCIPHWKESSNCVSTFTLHLFTAMMDQKPNQSSAWVMEESKKSDVFWLKDHNCFFHQYCQWMNWQMNGKYWGGGC